MSIADSPFTSAELENSALLADLERSNKRMARSNHSSRELIEAKNTINVQQAKINKLTRALRAMKERMK